MRKWTNKFNLYSCLMLVVLMLPVVFLSFGKADTSVSAVQSQQVQQIFYTSIPQRPVVLKEVVSYKDASLKEKTGQIKPKTQLQIIALKGKSFELSNHQYVSADSKSIISDVLMSKKDVNQTIYTTKAVDVLYNPYTTFDTKVYITLPAGRSLQANKMARTNWGTYYQISFNGGQTGWVDSQSVTTNNPQMVVLQKLLNQKYSDSKYSIYVKDLESGNVIGVNQNEKMYSASLSKLPILYWVQKRINKGEINLSDNLTYTSKVNGWSGSYEANGTGSLPDSADKKNYTVLDLINRTAKQSDNVASNILSYYETNQFNPEFQKEIDQIAGGHWDMKERIVSSQMVGQVLDALYNEGGASFNALINTNFDNIKIKAGVPSNITVAHKIGDADDYSHDAAIVFATHPYILVVETNGGEGQITQISQDVYGVLK